MALDQYHHGVRVAEISDGKRSIRTISTAIIGVVCTASDADATAFPLDQPILITNVAARPVPKAHCDARWKPSPNQCKPIIVAVRVAEGIDDAETTANIIATTTATGQRTGLQALLTANQKLGVKPCILGVPELDSQPVAAELLVIARKLRAFAYASAFEAATLIDATAYRDQFGGRELMIIWPEFEPSTSPTPQPGQSALSPGHWACAPRSTRRPAGTSPSPTSWSTASPVFRRTCSGIYSHPTPMPGSSMPQTSPPSSSRAATHHVGHATIDMIQRRYGKWIRTDGQDVPQMIEKLLDL